MIRPADGERAKGHSGRKFLNPDHEKALDNVLMVAPHLKAHLN